MIRLSTTRTVICFANKKHKLPDGYEPSDLTTPNVTMRNSTWQFREEAARAMEEMFAAAAAEGVQLVCSSGYRSQDYQEYLWNNYAAQSGEEYADRISSRAGYSDHQTGLAVDLGVRPIRLWISIRSMRIRQRESGLRPMPISTGSSCAIPRGRRK